MSDPARRTSPDGPPLAGVIALWAVAMLPLAWWGLPDRSRDHLLFAGGPVWKPQDFRAAGALEALRNRAGGADTDLNPIQERRRLVDLTATDAARAEILLRYRLYSRQPDENITFRALQRMKPRELDFDPKLYQYGGAYIYLIGAALGASSVVGAIRVTGDIDFYLAQPEQFARFYIAARIVTLAFGGLLLWAVFRLGTRVGGPPAGWLALLLTAASPVFITGALEAKPHLPAVCMILWAADAALAWADHGRRRDLLRMALSGGLAFGLVLTGIVAAAILPVLALVRRPIGGNVSRMGGAVLLAAAVYLATNPYVPLNLLRGRESLASNISNSTAMYEIGRFREGARRVADLLTESCGAGVVLAGGMAGVALLTRRREAWIAAAPAIATLVICIAIGAGKPAEFARFLLLPAVLLCIGAAWFVVAIARRWSPGGVIAGLALLAAMKTPACINAFAVDAQGAPESRRQAAELLVSSMAPGDRLGLFQEPAPYATPPLDFWRRPVMLLPEDPPPHYTPEQLPEWVVLTADSLVNVHGAWWKAYYDIFEIFPGLSPGWTIRIPWANKAVFIFRKRGWAAEGAHLMPAATRTTTGRALSRHWPRSRVAPRL